MTTKVIPLDLFWEAAKGNVNIEIFTFPVITKNPPVGKFVVGGPLGSGPNGVLYPYDVPPSQVSIVSTDPDDNATGTGARSILIFGTSEPGGKIQSELITLNGTTPVLTTQIFQTVNPFSTVFAVNDSGSNGFAQGDITFELSGTVVHKIRAGLNRDITSGGNTFTDTAVFFFNQNYSTNKQAEIIFQIRDNSIPNSGFVNFDHVIIEKGEEHYTDFAKAPVRIPSGASVQSIIKVRFPETNVLITARASNISNSLL